MAPSTIAIKIEFGAESGAGANSVAVNGTVPMPVMSAQSSAALRGDAAAGELPTPMGGATQMMTRAESEPPVPSPGFGAASAVSSASSEDIPTPFSGAPSATAQGAVPTPLDSAHGHNIVENRSPTPHQGSEGQPDQLSSTPSNPPGAPEAPGKKGRK